MSSIYYKAVEQQVKGTTGRLNVSFIPRNSTNNNQDKKILLGEDHFTVTSASSQHLRKKRCSGHEQNKTNVNSNNSTTDGGINNKTSIMSHSDFESANNNGERSETMSNSEINNKVAQKKHTMKKIDKDAQMRHTTRFSSKNVIPTKISIRSGTSTDNSFAVTTTAKTFTYTTNHQTTSAASHNPGRNKMTVELLVVVDYSIFQRFYQKSAAISLEQRSGEAKKKIRHYFIHIVDKIDQIYSKLKTNKFSLSVKMTGLHIVENAVQSPWTELFRRKSVTRDLVDAFKALNKFHSWVNKPTVNLPHHEHAILFTGYDLYNVGHDGNVNTDVLGLGYQNAMCTSSSQSIIEDRGAFESVKTAVHELAHVLGARHDDDGNECSVNSEHIMTPITKSAQQLTFSSCSIRYFERYLTLLSRFRKNCLLNAAEHFLSKSEWKSAMTQQPGQQYPPDQQCQQVYGSTSYYCGGEKQDEMICRQMFCYNPELKACYQPGSLKAAQGTTCGNHKWCKSEVCVEESEAPAASGICPHGDTPGPVYTNVNDTCAHAGINCYEPFFKNRCCESCGKLYKQELPGCEYGDRSHQCKPYHCQNPGNWRICCETCAKYLKSKFPWQQL